jgi:hypothetical protein
MRWVPVRRYSMAGFGHLFARQMSGFLSRPCFQPSRDSPRSPQGHDCSGVAAGSCGQAAQRADRVLQRDDDFTEQRLQESRGRGGGRGGNVFVADAGNNAVKEMVVSNPPSLTFTQTAVGMRSHSLGNGYVRSCLFLFTNRENAPDRLQALLLLSVVAI